MKQSRNYTIEVLASNGKLTELKELLGTEFTQAEIDSALGNALAYSQIKTAEYLFSIGADITWEAYYGVYYAVHNNELEGVKFAISHGVDPNICNGLLLNVSVVTAYNQRDTSVLAWLLGQGASASFLSDSTLQAFGTNEILEILKRHTTSNGHDDRAND